MKTQDKRRQNVSKSDAPNFSFESFIQKVTLSLTQTGFFLQAKDTESVIWAGFTVEATTPTPKAVPRCTRLRTTSCMIWMDGICLNCGILDKSKNILWKNRRTHGYLGSVYMKSPNMNPFPVDFNYFSFILKATIRNLPFFLHKNSWNQRDYGSITDSSLHAAVIYQHRDSASLFKGTTRHMVWHRTQECSNIFVQLLFCVCLLVLQAICKTQKSQNFETNIAAKTKKKHIMRL